MKKAMMGVFFLLVCGVILAAGDTCYVSTDSLGKSLRLSDRVYVVVNQISPKSGFIDLLKNNLAGILSSIFSLAVLCYSYYSNKLTTRVKIITDINQKWVSDFRPLYGKFKSDINLIIQLDNNRRILTDDELRIALNKVRLEYLDTYNLLLVYFNTTNPEESLIRMRIEMLITTITPMLMDLKASELKQLIMDDSIIGLLVKESRELDTLVSLCIQRKLELADTKFSVSEYLNIKS